MPTAKTGGRPSLLESERIGSRIVETATEMFLASGYGATSIEKIASACGISKRTFYHRFENKAALFAEVVHGIVSRLHSADTFSLFEGENPESVLPELANALLQAALQPMTLALHRIIIAESAQFPELASVVENEGAKAQAISMIEQYFEREVKQRAMTLRDCRVAAELFFHMVLAAPQRRAMLGKPMSAQELASWADDAVYVFLKGCGR